jgi:hypothetical protein
VRLAVAVATLALALVLAAPIARAQPDDAFAADEALPDYDPQSSQWNGLSSFIGLAGGMGYDVKIMASLEWKDLGAEDILVLIYPLRRVDPAKIDAFIKVGGHVLLADDFGESSDALTRLDVARADVAAPDAQKFHENRAYAPIATPLSADHPVASEVKEVVTNHPAVLTRVRGATAVIGFQPDQAVVVAGDRGTGRFVVVSDPSIFINNMQEFEGNAQLAANILRWLDRGGRARSVVVLRGDVPMYGEPRPFIDDAGAGPVARQVIDLNDWLYRRSEWLLTPTAMRVIAAILALVLVTLVVIAMPLRKPATADGSWLRFTRPGRRDAPDKLIAAAERGDGSMIVAACVLRDVAQTALARVIGRADPIYTMSEGELVSAVNAARDPGAGAQVSRVYKRLRALPSRSQAAAPWGGGELPRREFDRLYHDVGELCRTLGEEIA